MGGPLAVDATYRRRRRLPSCSGFLEGSSTAAASFTAFRKVGSSGPFPAGASSTSSVLSLSAVQKAICTRIRAAGGPVAMPPDPRHAARPSRFRWTSVEGSQLKSPAVARSEPQKFPENDGSGEWNLTCAADRGFLVKGKREEIMRKLLWMVVVAIVAFGGMAIAGDYEGPVVNGDRVIPDYPNASPLIMVPISL